MRVLVRMDSHTSDVKIASQVPMFLVGNAESQRHSGRCRGRGRPMKATLKTSSHSRDKARARAREERGSWEGGGGDKRGWGHVGECPLT
jgi:hypothetical protein